jgi:hypothetical protein
VWNTGGFRRNAEFFFDIVERDFDVFIFNEVFLTEETEKLVQFPGNFVSFISHGIRGEGINQGRTTGGILILLRSSIFDGTKCKIRSKSHSHLAVTVQPRNGQPFCVVGVYRSGSSRSPVYDACFFQHLGRVCTDAREEGLSVLVAGDFNAKIGTIDGAFGGVDEFVDFLPLASESEEVNDEGAEMLSLFDKLDFHRLPFAVGGVEQLTFERLEEDGSLFGSIIDHVFFSADLLMSVTRTWIKWDNHSTHLGLAWELTIEATADEPVTATEHSFLALDFAKVMELTHTPELVQLATDPDSFTSRVACDTVLNFISTYTKTVTIKERKKAYSKELQELNTTIRRVRRLWAREKFSERGKIRGAELSRLARLWRERRDLERKIEIEELRRRFWEAHYSGQAYKAWQYAKKNLSGKGGGIRTSVTQGISRTAWESHFSRLLGRSGQAPDNLLEIQLRGV